MSVVCAQLRGVVRARADGPPGPGRVCVCVCGGSNVGQSLSTIVPAAGVGVQCSVVQVPVQLCVALLAACDVTLYAAAAQRCDLDDLSDGNGRCNSR